jgi:hypothetical protein
VTGRDTMIPSSSPLFRRPAIAFSGINSGLASVWGSIFTSRTPVLRRPECF